MERHALHELCHQVVHTLVTEQGWLLSTSSIQNFIDAIFPFVQSGTEPTPQMIRTIALNYNVDGPTVQLLLAPQSVQGNALWTEWRTRFHKIALSQRLTNDDAEDLVQSVYLEAFKALRTFRFQSRLNTYLIAIFNNQHKKWLQEHTKAQKTVVIVESLDEAVLSGDPPTEQIANAEIYALVKREITRILNSPDYQILYWYYGEEEYVDPATGERKKWTDKAIGEKLGIPLNTVTAKRMRSLQRLRQSPQLAQLAALFNLPIADDL